MAGLTDDATKKKAFLAFWRVTPWIRWIPTMEVRLTYAIGGNSGTVKSFSVVSAVRDGRLYLVRETRKISILPETILSVPAAINLDLHPLTPDPLSVVFDCTPFVCTVNHSIRESMFADLFGEQFCTYAILLSNVSYFEDCFTRSVDIWKITKSSTL